MVPVSAVIADGVMTRLPLGSDAEMPEAEMLILKSANTSFEP
jgi:hypothetical protein